MEQQLFHLINQQWTGDFADWLMAVTTSLDFWVVPIALLLGSILIFGGFKGRAMVVVLALTIALTDGVVVKAIKESTNRLRPSQYDGTRLVQMAKARPKILGALKEPKVKMAKIKKPQLRGVSFPSGHTANNFAAAAVLMLFFPRRGWLYLPLAFLVSYSRIYTGSHWPGDVTFSIVLGLVMGAGVTNGCNLLWRRFGPRMVPKLYQHHPSLIGSRNVDPDPASIT